MTELGAYAFSDHFSMEDYEKETLMLWNTVSEKSREVSVSDMQNVIADINSRDGKALAGGDLTEVWIPDSLEKIGRYAFYNCFSLKRLSFGENLKDVGRCIYRLPSDWRTAGKGGRRKSRVSQGHSDRSDGRTPGCL